MYHVLYTILLLQALVEIGDYIQGCLSEFKSEDDGRTNLWIFVSKFTEDTSEQLQKLYKRAKKEVSATKQQVCVHTLKLSSLSSPSLLSFPPSLLSHVNNESILCLFD